MRIRVIVAVMLCTLLAALTPSALAAPPGCPYDGNGDGRVDVNDLNHLTQNPADINGDSLANADDIACLKEYLRCAEVLEMAYRPGEPAADGMVPSASYFQSAVPGGLSQTLAVTRTPSPDGASCVSQMWTTTLLGTRPGLSGPIEIRLDRDGFLWQPLFADAASTSPGTTAQRIMLTCEGSAIEFVAASSAMTVRSSSESRALVLLDGQNVTAMAVAKGVANAASRMIGGGLVAGYVDVNGNVSLPARGMLVLYELDTGATSDPSFAFDDAAVLVDLECGDIADMTPQLIVLRDSIGPDISMTDGGRGFTVTQTGTNHNFAAIFVTPTQNTELTELRAIMSSATSTLNIAAFDYEVRIWTGQGSGTAHDAVLASPLNGNAFPDIFFSPLPALPPNWGTSTSPNGVTLPAFDFVFDLSGRGLNLQAGKTYAVALAPRRNGGGTNGTMTMVESPIDLGDSDIAYSVGIPVGWIAVSESPSSLGHGRMGVRLLGMRN